MPTCQVVGLGRRLADKTGANVLDRVGQGNLLGNRDTVVHDPGRAELGLEDNVPALQRGGRAKEGGTGLGTCTRRFTLGPRVTPTTVASLSTPACILFMASPLVLKCSSCMGVGAHDRHELRWSCTRRQFTLAAWTDSDRLGARREMRCPPTRWASLQRVGIRRRLEGLPARVPFRAATQADGAGHNPDELSSGYQVEKQKIFGETMRSIARRGLGFRWSAHRLDCAALWIKHKPLIIIKIQSDSVA